MENNVGIRIILKIAGMEIIVNTKTKSINTIYYKKWQMKHGRKHFLLKI
jgi:hypothetical protein